MAGVRKPPQLPAAQPEVPIIPVRERQRGEIMGIFDKAKEEAENAAQQDPNLMNQAGQEANQATGARFSNQINEGVQAAQNRIGQQGGQGQGQNQGQGQGQSQSGQQGGGFGQGQGQGQGQ